MNDCLSTVRAHERPPPASNTLAIANVLVRLILSILPDRFIISETISYNGLHASFFEGTQMRKYICQKGSAIVH